MYVQLLKRRHRIKVPEKPGYSHTLPKDHHLSHSTSGEYPTVVTSLPVMISTQVFGLGFLNSHKIVRTPPSLPFQMMAGSMNKM